MKIIQIENLVKKYGDTVAIDHMLLTINEGEIYGLLGPNGAGKSTLIHILCDIIKKDAGEIYFFEEKVKSNRKNYKNDIGIVPQNIAIFEDLTAYENVKFFASLYGLKGSELKNNVEEALSFVGLLDQKKLYPKTFSGGMKRRLNIACAIAHKPKVLFMDEPTVGIDPQSKHHILKSVKKLNEMGTTIVYSTHLMEEAEYLCTTVGILDHGKLIAEGTCDTLQSIVTDKKSIIIRFDFEKTIDVEKLKGIKGVLDVQLNESEMTVDCLKESDCLSDVLLYFNQEDIKIHDINMKGASLEMAFLSLTGRRLRD